MKYYLTACLMVRDEELYINEWLTYHLNTGFDHIYIYDNYSKDRTVDIALSYGNRVTVKQVFGSAMQYKTYSTCFVDHGAETRWLAFIDTDEYLVPKKQSTVEVLKNYENFGALCVHWVLFGDNGHKKYENKPVIERFTKRESGVNKHVKSIIDPKKSLKLWSSHKWFHSVPAVDENFKILEDTDSTPSEATANIIQLNHYAIKSYEECYERRVGKIRPDTHSNRNFSQFYSEHNKNEIDDFTALNIWKSIKK